MSWLNRNYQNLLAIILVGWILFVPGYSFYIHQYPVPPGDDSLRHMTLAQGILDDQHIVELKDTSGVEAPLNDVPLLHILLASVSSITNVSIILATQVFVIYLFGVIALILYFLTSKIVDHKSAGLIALVILICFSPQPFMIYSEGTFNDIYSASILLPLAIYFLAKYFNDQKATKYFILTIIFGLSIMFSHPLTAIGFLFILVLFNLQAIVLKLFNKNKYYFKKIFLFDFIFIVPSLVIAWPYYFKGMFVKISAIFIKSSSGSSIGYVEDYFLSLPDYSTYVFFISEIIIYLAILGLVLLWRENKQWKKYNYLLIWMVAFFILSRLTIIQLPMRFARLLYLPLIILSALAIYYFFKNIIHRKYVNYIFIFVCLIISGFYCYSAFIVNTGYIQTTRIQKVDLEAVEWMKNNTTSDDVFLGTPQIAGGWGSFVGLLSDRKIIDCSQVSYNCDIVYNPTSDTSKKAFKESGADYVYVGKPLFGSHLYKDYLNWSYYTPLAHADFLDKEFDYRDKAGRVLIYKINKNKL